MKSSVKSRILIFGGSFNPPTLAHQALINACLELPGFKEVWVMPSGDRHDKQMNMDDSHRLAMVNLVKQEQFHNNPRLHISDFEFQLPCPTQTYKTVQALAAAYGDVNFWFTFGTDSYFSMPSWDYGTELQSTLSMVVVERNKVEPPKRQGIIPLCSGAPDGLSSTKVRALVSNGRSLEGYVCKSVEQYIKDNKLYQ